jgi:hypothetical protein
METNYFWDSVTGTCLAELDENGDVTVQYTTNPQTGELISENRDGEEVYHHYDGDGNTRQTTDSAGNVLGEATYTAFGETVAESGDMKTVYRFRGQQGFSTDPATGDVSRGIQNYAPSLGRRLSLASFVAGNYNRPNRYVPVMADLQQFLGWRQRSPARGPECGAPGWTVLAGGWTWHYYFGGGRPAYIVPGSAMYEYVWGSDEISAHIGETRELVQGLLDGRTRAMKCGEKLDIHEARTFNFVARLTTVVFEIGDSYIQVVVNCKVISFPPCDCCNQIFRRCTIEYKMRDWFEDPWDVGFEIGGWPYAICSDYTEKFSHWTDSCKVAESGVPPWERKQE